MLPPTQTLYFEDLELGMTAPVRIGDFVEATVEVIKRFEKGRRVKLACHCKVGEILVLEGEALVKVPEKPEGY